MDTDESDLWFNILCACNIARSVTIPLRAHVVHIGMRHLRAFFVQVVAAMEFFSHIIACFLAVGRFILPLAPQSVDVTMVHQKLRSVGCSSC